MGLAALHQPSRRNDHGKIQQHQASRELAWSLRGAGAVPGSQGKNLTMSEPDKDRVRKAGEMYQAKQAREKQIQDLRERLEKPGMKLKVSILMVAGFIFIVQAIYGLLA